MIKIEEVQVIEVSEWNDLVKKTYGKPYNFQQQDDCQERGLVSITIPDEPNDYENDTIPEDMETEEMGVSFKAWLARDPKEWKGDPEDKSFLYMFWERNFYPDVQTLANDLHAKGLIPAGKYEINIDW